MYNIFQVIIDILNQMEEIVPKLNLTSNDSMNKSWFSKQAETERVSIVNNPKDGTITVEKTYRSHSLKSAISDRGNTNRR